MKARQSTPDSLMILLDFAKLACTEANFSETCPAFPVATISGGRDGNDNSEVGWDAEEKT